MTEHPIIFSAPMVRAILVGGKTQTRRVLRDQQPIDLGASMHGTHLSRRPVHDHGKLVGHRMTPVRCPFGIPGDRLWVRESGWERPERSHRDMREGADTWKPYYFDADISEADHEQFKEWRFIRRPSIHMPRQVCRLFLDVTAARVERLQEISGRDAWAEGVIAGALSDMSAIAAYRQLWNELNGKRRFGWDVNPWVWVVEFKRG